MTVDPRFRATEALAPGYAVSLGGLVRKLAPAILLSALLWALIAWAVFA